MIFSTSTRASLRLTPMDFKNLGGHTRTFADQAQQNLLGANEVVAEAASLFLGQHDDLDGLLGNRSNIGLVLIC